MYRPVYRSFGDIAQGVDHFAVPNLPPRSRQQTNMGSLLGEAPIPLPLYDNFLDPSTAERMLPYGEPLSRYVSSDGGDSFVSSPSPASPMMNNSVQNLYGLQESSPGSPMPSQFQEGFSNGVAAASPYSSQSPSSGFDAASPRILPDDSQGESSNSGRDYPVICLFPSCDARPFKRRADLDRHYKHRHAPESQKESYYCDYPKCARRRDPFHRRDHFRDHLREFHKEDIEKRGGTVKEEWLDGRNTSSTWWRCAKCLTRIYVDKSGYECPGCKTTCQPKRKAIRQKD